jgi:hypothetical protein
MTARAFLTPSLAGLFLVVVACSGSSGGIGSPPGIYCSASSAGVSVCYGYANLTGDQEDAVKQTCTEALQGTITSQCPTTNEIGCCTQPTDGYSTTECYYAGQASSYSAACKAAGGTWSGGGGSGDGGTGSSGGSSSGSTSGGSSSGGSSSGGSGGSSSGAASSSGSGSGSGGGCSAPDVACPGGCADLQTDLANCGSCEVACPQGPSGTTPACKGGTCVDECTTAGTTLCDDKYCDDLQTSVYSCGACDHACKADAPAGATSSCVDAQCKYSCASGQVVCNDACIDVLSDDSNCGSCGHQCGTNTVCSGGSCVAGCTNGWTLCNGTCVNTGMDAQNCGGCGIQCPITAASCENSACTCEVYCVTQFDSPYCCPAGQNCFENGCQ